MNNRKFLLLGGNGFLGKGLQKELAFRNIEFTVIDQTSASDQSGVIKIDLLDDWSKALPYFEGVTDVVILASRVGATTFKTSPVQAGVVNIKLLTNCFDLIVKASEKYHTAYKIVWYSSSEIFGSTDQPITETSPIKIDYSNARSIYAQIKLLGETLFQSLQTTYPTVCSSIVTIRPFNVSGENQCRGVVYEMVKNAMTTGIIPYSKNTVRTLTPLKTASIKTIDAILNTDNTSINIADPMLTTTMYTLAVCISEAIYKFTKKQVELKEYPEDHDIMSRCVDPSWLNKNSKDKTVIYMAIEPMVKNFLNQYEQNP